MSTHTTIRSASRKTKAYWRAEQRHRALWEKERHQTDAARAYGSYLIAQERVQGFAAGWEAGIAWARREQRRT